MAPKDVILISDGEEDNDVAFLPSRSTIKPVPILVDSGSSQVSEEEFELPSLRSLLPSDRSGAASSSRRAGETGKSVSVDRPIPSIPVTAPAPVHTARRKGKEKAVPDALSGAQTATTSLLDLLDDESSLDELTPLPESPPTFKDDEGVDRETGPKGKKRKSIEDEGLSSKRAGVSKEARVAAKAKEKADKQLAKGTAKAAKEAQASYKKKLVDANKLRTRKDDVIREVHLYMSDDLGKPSSVLAGALPEIQARIETSRSALHFINHVNIHGQPIDNVIRFKRHLQARWDQNQKCFIPLDEPIWVWEPVVIFVFPADEIVGQVQFKTFDGWASQSRFDAEALEDAQNTDVQVFMMVRGLGKHYTKVKTARNREFEASARAELEGRARAVTGMPKEPGKAEVEAALLEAQLAHRLHWVLVEKTEDIETWLWNLAADTALRPYKLLSKSHLNFAPPDRVRKAATSQDALEMFLQEVQGITESASRGIAKEWPTFKDLMEAYERAESRNVERAEGLVQECEIRTNKSGAASGRKVGKALSKRVYNTFRGTDSLALV